MSPTNGYPKGCAAAKTACENRNATLVSIPTEADNLFVFCNLSRPYISVMSEPTLSVKVSGLANQGTCIGLVSTGTQPNASLWKWSNGEPYAYQNWLPGNPNGVDSYIPEISRIMALAVAVHKCRRDPLVQLGRAIRASGMTCIAAQTRRHRALREMLFARKQQISTLFKGGSMDTNKTNRPEVV